MRQSESLSSHSDVDDTVAVLGPNRDVRGSSRSVSFPAVRFVSQDDPLGARPPFLVESVPGT